MLPMCNVPKILSENFSLSQSKTTIHSFQTESKYKNMSYSYQSTKQFMKCGTHVDAMQSPEPTLHVSYGCP